MERYAWSLTLGGFSARSKPKRGNRERFASKSKRSMSKTSEETLIEDLNLRVAVDEDSVDNIMTSQIILAICCLETLIYQQGVGDVTAEDRTSYETNACEHGLRIDVVLDRLASLVDTSLVLNRREAPHHAQMVVARDFGTIDKLCHDFFDFRRVLVADGHICLIPSPLV
ncbi:hypothetical protein EVAR_47310_1 [Eumeta japonica]|uniref:Uncharacterized protein n=1 Tax=Eumeta variegata TaxID=151549 RepID=A0A4C1YJ25_EUMVA|nr:hypothetical protein EVAR_47310_1 [Eumeta japonica]